MPLGSITPLTGSVPAGPVGEKLVFQSPASSRAAVARSAILLALGMPGIVLFASFLGFGSLARGGATSLPEALISTLIVWALPGQIVLLEMQSVGASLLAIVAAVALTNARLMPMVVTLMPLLERPGEPRWRFYLMSHLVAITAWANSLQVLPTLPPEHRVSWFLAFAGTLYVNTVVATVAGYYLAGLVPSAVTLGLVFVNPIYFMLLFIMDLRQRARLLALAFGAVLGPSLHGVLPGYGLLVSGLVGGTLALAVDEFLRPHRQGAA